MVFKPQRLVKSLGEMVLMEKRLRTEPGAPQPVEEMKRRRNLSKAREPAEGGCDLLCPALGQMLPTSKHDTSL